MLASPPVQVRAYRAMQELHQAQGDDEGDAAGPEEQQQQQVVALLGERYGHLLHKLHRLLYLEESVFG